MMVKHWMEPCKTSILGDIQTYTAQGAEQAFG